MVHSGGHEVTSTAGSYDIDKGIRVELTPQLRDEVIIHEVLQANSVNTTRRRYGITQSAYFTVGISTILFMLGSR